MYKLIKEYGDSIIYTDSTRSPNGEPVQYACRSKKLHKPGGAGVGAQVVIDCVLLSRCSKLIRGFSNVASVASFFNPEMELEYVCKYNQADRDFLEITEDGLGRKK